MVHIQRRSVEIAAARWPFAVARLKRSDFSHQRQYVIRKGLTAPSSVGWYGEIEKEGYFRETGRFVVYNEMTTTTTF